MTLPSKSVRPTRIKIVQVDILKAKLMLHNQIYNVHLHAHLTLGMATLRFIFAVCRRSVLLF